jgi:hypothetical protein
MGVPLDRRERLEYGGISILDPVAEVNPVALQRVSAADLVVYLEGVPERCPSADVEIRSREKVVVRFLVHATVVVPVHDHGAHDERGVVPWPTKGEPSKETG